MKVRIQDSNGDMTFGSSQLNFYQDSTSGVAQLVQTALLLFLGEWFLDLDAGVPYLEQVLGKHSIDTADTAIRSAVLDVQVIDDNGNTVNAVNDISSYSSAIDPITRKMSVTMVLDTIYGPTPLEIASYAVF